VRKFPGSAWRENRETKVERDWDLQNPGATILEKSGSARTSRWTESRRTRPERKAFRSAAGGPRLATKTEKRGRPSRSTRYGQRRHCRLTGRARRDSLEGPNESAPARLVPCRSVYPDVSVGLDRGDEGRASILRDGPRRLDRGDRAGGVLRPRRREDREDRRLVFGSPAGVEHVHDRRPTVRRRRPRIRKRVSSECFASGSNRPP
jgi:hypothetical protein